MTRGGLVHARRALRRGLLGALLCAAGAAGAEGALPNRYCPVQPKKLASARFSAVYEGRKVHFCCRDCLEAFTATPQAFLANLPPAPATGGLLGHDHPPGWRPPGSEAPGEGDGDGATAPAGTAARRPSHSHHAITVLERYRWPAAALVPVLAFVLARSVRRRGGIAALREELSRGLRLLRRPAVLVALAQLLVIAALVVALDRTRFRLAYVEDRLQRAEASVAQARLLDRIHYATFSDFGSPPVPVRAPGPPRLRATFYRGNDEREASLFNGGHYRTATFHVAVRAGDGRDAEPGEDLSGQPVFVRLEIERGPNTPDFFWLPERMETMYLTREADPFLGAKGPAPDRVALRALEPLRRWEGLYPLGAAPSGDATWSGIVYVREHLGKGARFHYGLAYSLDFRGGRLTRGSDLSMGALYRTRKVVPTRLPLSEWFSHEPIPVLPAERDADLDTLRGEVDTGLGPPQ